jgi:hypothetical protein
MLPLDTFKPAVRRRVTWAADRLASLGYPHFAYRRQSGKLSNPSEVLLLTLAMEPADPRLTEAMPWLLLNFDGFNQEQLVTAARELNIQNRLGFIVSIAKTVAESSPALSHRVQELMALESALEPYRLAREDDFGQSFRSERLRSWIMRSRSKAAAHWNLVSDLSPEHLPYVN